jgi:hypothetical protein
MYASENGRSMVVQRLIAAGAELNVQNMVSVCMCVCVMVRECQLASSFNCTWERWERCSYNVVPVAFLR